MEHPKFCPHCGTATVGEMKFCPSCAKSIVIGDIPAPSPSKKPVSPWAVSACIVAGFVLLYSLIHVAHLRPVPGPQVVGMGGHIVPPGQDTLAARDIDTFDTLAKVSSDQLDALSR
jgi:hypothetical protein